MKESIIYFSIKIFGGFVRLLPLNAALFLGRCIGVLVYYFDTKHKAIAYANLKMAFSKEKSSHEIKKITKKLFMNYGENLMELLRMPLLDKTKYEDYVQIEGKENVGKGLEQKNGAILLAMHFGSWEMASLACAMLDYPYKVIVKPQTKYSKLDDLLNSYRACGGNVVLSRGMGTRDLIKSLKNNEVIGMVVDQGGKDGALVPFFGRKASMSVGAIRLALKLKVPIHFAIIIRQGKGRHKMIFHETMDLVDTGDVEQDITANLKKITVIMEDYIRQYPSEYMWFYKIWKYSNENTIAILNDGRTGHLRQSQAVAKQLEKALSTRNIETNIEEIAVTFKNNFSRKCFSFLSMMGNPFLFQGRLEFLKWFLTAESFRAVTSIKAEFVISAGSSTAGINRLMSYDLHAKSIVIQKPGLCSPKRFDLVLLPEHDLKQGKPVPPQVTATTASINLINEEYLQDQSERLLNHFSHLKNSHRFTIGVLLGGDAEDVFISEEQVRILCHQLKEVSRALKANILLTTSRRTPEKIEHLLHRELKKFEYCPLLILANQENYPEAVGGIMGLADVIITSGDSISMMSEAASSGKTTLVFLPELKAGRTRDSVKHVRVVNSLHQRGFIVSVDLKHSGQVLYDVAKGKVKTKTIDDAENVYQAVRKLI